jgi:DNA-binding transcriptional regulator YhcF (GntR family)
VRLWFAASSEVPVYRQLVTQVVLAILSGELRPGDRLPSTRELARRFGLHPNTISAGYRQLQREGWTELRHGSGVYVRKHKEPVPTPEQLLDQHIARFVRDLRTIPLPAATIRHRLEQRLAAPPPSRLVLVEPDAELRQILLAETRAATSLPVSTSSPEECARHKPSPPAIYVCRPSKATAIRSILPPGAELVVLPIRSANAWLAPWLPVPQGQLVAIVSRWPDFLGTARTMLIAAGVPAESLFFRDARQSHGRRGLDQASILLCDVLTSKLPLFRADSRVVTFPLLADSARDELAPYADSLSL